MNRCMTTPTRLAVLALVVVSLVPLGGAAEACATSHIRISLFGFPPEAVSRGFYYVSEPTDTSFSIGAGGDACEEPAAVDYATSGGSATPGSDYQPVSGTAQLFLPTHGTDSMTVPVTISPDEEVEQPVVEWTQIVLSNPQNAALAETSTAPLFIIDDDGSARVGFEGDSYSQSETLTAVRIPVFRAGDASGSTSVSYSVSPAPTNPATPGADYHAAPQGTLNFAPNDRVEGIDLTIVNDQVSEASEGVVISLTGDSVVAGNMTLTILDNEESQAPTSRFHHPRNRWKYNKADYRIREFHIFAIDEGGSGVVAAEMALRRNLVNGKCAWKVKKGWQKKDCQNRTWLPTKYDDVGELFFYRMNQLKPSVKTKIKNYTAFSQAIDGAGNVEKEFTKKRNMNTFEIRRKGKTQKA
jgi:hypothetical protein